MLALVSTLARAQSRQTSASAAPAATQADQAASTVIPVDQQPTKEQLAKLFEVMRLKEQMQTMRKMMPAMVQQQIKDQTSAMESSLPAGTKLTPKQRADMESLISRYVEKAVNIYPVEEMIDDMSGLYQQHLSRDDVDGMIAFFSSPVGQHLLDQQPVIAKEYMPLVMKRVSERSQALTKEMMKELATMTEIAKPTPAKATPTKPAAK